MGGEGRAGMNLEKHMHIFHGRTWMAAGRTKYIFKKIHKIHKSTDHSFPTRWRWHQNISCGKDIVSLASYAVMIRSVTDPM